MPIFARRHYQAIVEELKRSYESTCNSYTRTTLMCLALNFASMFLRDNPNFNQERFLKACEMEGE